MVKSNKIDFACHAMDHIASGKCSNGCSMNELYLGETIPREYAESIMMELTQKGFLLNEDKINGRYKLAKPWNDAASHEITELMNNLWCWPSTMSVSHKKRGAHKKVNGDNSVVLAQLE